MKATVCLHNFLINWESQFGANKRYCANSSADRENDNGDIMEGDWRRETNLNVLSIKRTSLNMYGKVAENMRHKLCQYFLEDGAIPFQWNK